MFIVSTAFPATEPPRSYGASTLRTQTARLPSEGEVTNEQLSALVESVALRRDRQAFSRLFTYFAPKLKSFALRRGISSNAAEELVQETMLAVWRRADTFDRRRASVSTWIFTIVRNKRIDLLRRGTFPEVDLEQAADQPEDGHDPDERADLAKFATDLHRALQMLPKEQAEILQRAFFEEKTHRSIASELGLPLGTVKSRIRLALTRLRAALRGNDQ